MGGQQLVAPPYDPNNDNTFASPESLKYWLNVDWYSGGMEHTTLHLLYSRFGICSSMTSAVPSPEPYQRTSHGMILGENGEKMSKSRGNVINLTIALQISARMPPACTRCSWARLTKRSVEYERGVAAVDSSTVCKGG